MRATVISFPGSNREQDAEYALKQAGFRVTISPAHSSADFLHADVILLPGGFSYGDYLRSGAIAAKLPIMHDVQKAAEVGRYVIGICNGFQILTESGLLPGALRMNAGQIFLCKTVQLIVENTETAFSHSYRLKQILDVPIAHHEGNYIADENTLETLEKDNRIVFRYADNPNGSAANIAGICNNTGNVMGMMPHPENAALPHHASDDGAGIFTALAQRIGS